MIKFYSLTEAAGILKMSREGLYRAIKGNGITPLMVRGKSPTREQIRLTGDHIIVLMKRKRRGPVPKPRSHAD
jgi:hypothetical protein